MTTELACLLWATLLGLVHVIGGAQMLTWQQGIAYGLSPRDEERKLTGVPARVQRAFANYMQTFPFFAVAVLVAHLADRHSWMTVLGAQMYVWARLAFIPLYAVGIPGPRTVAFLVSIVGIALILVACT